MKYLIGVLWSLAALNAAYVNQDCSSASVTSPVTVTAASPSASMTVTCPQFDSSLGVLTQVVFGFNLYPSGSPQTITVRNDGATTQDLTVYPQTIALLGFTSVTYPGQGPKSLGAFPITLNGSLSAGETATLPATSPGVYNSNENVADISGFPGVGSVDIFLALTTSRNSSFFPDIAVLDYSMSFVLAPSPLRVVYIYDEVPEPGTWTTAGLALLAIVHRRRIWRSLNERDERAN